jgi:DNA polymerase III delta subunit
MIGISFFELMKQIKSGQGDFCFTILHGFNEFLGELLIDTFCRHFLERKSDFNYRRYYFDVENQCSWEEIIQEAKSSSFFIQSRKILVVVIREEKWIQIDKADMEMLRNYLSSPNPNTVLMLYVSLNANKDEYRQLKKSRITPLIEKLKSKNTCSVDLDRISESEVKHYVKSYLNERGISITASALEKIVELKGEDYASIINQLPKFETSSLQEKSLDTEDVELIVTGIEPHSIWDLTEAIENEDTSRYLGILKYLFVNGVKPAFILGTLITHYNKIFTAKFLLKHNFPVNDIGKVLQQPHFILNKFISSVRNFSDAKLQQILRIIYRIDLELKTGGEDTARLSLQNFIFQIKLLSGKGKTRY